MPVRSRSNATSRSATGCSGRSVISRTRPASVSDTPPRAPSLARPRELSGPRWVCRRSCQTITFGHVEGLEERGGEPVSSPASVVVIEVKLEAEDGRRDEHDLGNFNLRAEALRLLA